MSILTEICKILENYETWPFLCCSVYRNHLVLDTQVLLLHCLVHSKCLFCQEILFKSAKKKKGMTVGFVNFENAEQLSSAMEVPLVIYTLCLLVFKLAMPFFDWYMGILM